MPKAGIKTEKGLKLKQRIFEIAIKLFEKNGFHRVTVDEICYKVGISRGNFYYYYASKDEIMMKLFHQNDNIYLNYYHEHISKVERAEDQLFCLTRKISEYIVSQGVDILKNVYCCQIDPTKPKDPYKSTQRPYYKITTDIIRKGQEQGEFRRDNTAEELTGLATMAIRGVSYEWCLRDGGFDFLATTDRMISLFISCIRTKDQPQ